MIDPVVATWRKSSFCNGASSCVEAREPSEEMGGMWQVRDGKDPESAVLVFTPGEWAAFTAGVRDGEFDLMTPAALSSGGVAPGSACAPPLADFGADSAPV